jgi:protein SCO1
LTVVVLIAIVVASACSGGGGSSKSDLSGAVRKPPLEVGSVVLPDESPGANGAPFAMRAAPGKLLLAYFGYTRCPDVCPTTLSDIGRGLEGLTKADRRRVDVAMVTIDPARDTGVVMNSYLDHFVRKGHALRTTDPAAQKAAQKAFVVTARKVPEADGNYGFEHTAVTYVINEHGKVVLEWPFGISARAMRHDLRTLLDRSKPAQQKEAQP